ncbi:hypothetical protein QUA70_24050 [Microcoleus sp. LAD1_D5]|uniref:hypothetical protein n=1 Tax=unclassified Microcoleus TaxID=2642155 RepID=UPI002FD6785D
MSKPCLRAKLWVRSILINRPNTTRDSNKVSPAVADFPEPADLLNQLKARRKKSGAKLADMEAVLDILENHQHES